MKPTQKDKPGFYHNFGVCFQAFYVRIIGTLELHSLSKSNENDVT
jgi:hypothetical protein